MAEFIGVSNATYRSIGLFGHDDKPPDDVLTTPPIDPIDDALVDVPTVSMANNLNSQKRISCRKILTARSVITSTMDLQNWLQYAFVEV